MPSVFSPLKIRGLEFRNRFMRSPTYDGLADEHGGVTDASVALYKDLAEGGLGLIVTGHAFVSEPGRGNLFGQYGIHTDEMVPGLRRLVKVAHDGGARIAVQINYAGISSRYLPARGITAVAPSLVEGSQTPHRALTGEEIERIVRDFSAAGVRAQEAGFDAVQLHGCHGYLMSQFLSPIFNRRTDRWGGTPEGRRRFHLEVIKEVRRRVGRDYPLFMKFGVMDDQEGGLTLEEGVQAAREMVAAGLDALEVSSSVGRGLRTFAPSGEPQQPYFRERTAAVKKAVPVPVAEVGGIRSLETAQAILEAGEADMVSLCRPLIREPGLVARWERDAAPARCISCNRCFWMIEHEGGLACYRERHPEAKD